MKFFPQIHTLLLLIAIACTGINECASAQNEILNRVISLSVKDKRLDEALNLIAGKGHFYFSYNTGIIKPDSVVTFSVNNKTVRQTLDGLFNRKIEYKQNGDHLILKKKNTPEAPIAGKTSYTVTGYIVNRLTGEEVQNASILEQTTLASTLSDPSGYFSLKLKSSINSPLLNVGKKDFLDTVIIVQPATDQRIVVSLSPVPQPITASISKEEIPSLDSTTQWLRNSDSNSVEKNKLTELLVPEKQKLFAENYDFTIHRTFQFSIFPFLSTNTQTSGAIVNDISLNLLGGYTGGTNILEIGGLFNINRHITQYFQIAGITNVDGGKVNGLQAAGLMNQNLHSMSGMQVAGFYNSNLDSTKGFQAAGFVNITGRKTEGVQAAGFCNVSGGHTTGAQFAGGLNVDAKGVSGVQFAGLGNVSGGTVRGMQAACVLNYATKLHGVQVGLLNVADTSNGVSIGFFNFVVKGFHKFELSGNETTPFNASLKTGTHDFYNIFTAGASTTDLPRYYTLGYGIGHEFPMGKKFGADAEVTGNYVYVGDWNLKNWIGRFSLNLAFQPAKTFGIIVGPSFNVYHPDESMVNENDFTIPTVDVKTFVIDAENGLYGWVGFNVGLRFF